MKTIALIMAASLMGLGATAQERWTVTLNSNVLLTANAEDTTANVVHLKELKKEVCW